MKRIAILLGLCILLGVLFSGCRIIRIEKEPLRELEYSLVKQEEIPEDLYALITEKKKKEFQLSYQTDKKLYLVKGYGRQMSGGYSIQVKELGLSRNAVIFCTRLLGPQDLNEAGGEPSYPYIVVKLENRKEPVQFE